MLSIVDAAGAQDDRAVDRDGAARIAAVWRRGIAATVARRPAAATLLPPGWFVALASIVAFIAIDRESIWLDEATSVLYARQPLDVMVGRIFNDVGGNMLGYQLLLQRWVRVVGEDPAAIRALSAVCAVIAACLVFALCRRSTSRGWALLGSLVFVVHVMYVEYAQETRAYSLMALAAAGSGLAFLEFLDRPGRARLAVYVLCASAMAWIHLMLAFVLAAHVLHALIWSRRAWRWWVPAFALAAAAWTPLLVSMAGKGSGGLSWIAPLGPEAGRQLVHLAGGQAPLLAIWLLVVAAGLVVAVARRDRVVGFAVVWLVAPVVLMLGVSVVQPIYLARYMIGVLPAASLLMASLGARLGRGWLIPTAVVLGLLTISTLRWESEPHKAPWNQAVAFVLARSEPGDSVVLFESFQAKPFGYYVRQLHSERRAPRIGDFNGDESRVWVVMNYSAKDGTPPALAQLLGRIEAGYRQAIPAATFGSIKIRLYEPISIAPAGAAGPGG